MILTQIDKFLESSQEQITHYRLIEQGLTSPPTQYR